MTGCDSLQTLNRVAYAFSCYFSCSRCRYSLYLEVFYKILQPKLGRKSITRRVLSLEGHAPNPGNGGSSPFLPSFWLLSIHTEPTPERGIEEVSCVISLPFSQLLGLPPPALLTVSYFFFLSASNLTKVWWYKQLFPQ